MKLLHISDLHFGSVGGRIAALDRGCLGAGVQMMAAALAAPLHDVLFFGPEVRDYLNGTHDVDVATALAGFVLAAPNVALVRRVHDHQIDAVVATGDLATFPRGELEEAWRFLSGQPCGTPLSLPRNAGVVVIPGNHDRFYGSGPLPFPFMPGGRHFEQFFPPASGTWLTDPVQVLFDSAPTTSRRAFLLLGVDLALPREVGTLLRPWTWPGQGRCDLDVAALLVRRTEEWRALHADGVILWAVHFHPQNHCKRTLRLEGARHLRAAAREAGVFAVLCGHTHARHFSRIRGPTRNIGVVCSASTTAAQVEGSPAPDIGGDEGALPDLFTEWMLGEPPTGAPEPGRNSAAKPREAPGFNVVELDLHRSAEPTMQVHAYLFDKRDHAFRRSSAPAWRV